jgi:hypothetical protein
MIVGGIESCMVAVKMSILVDDATGLWKGLLKVFLNVDYVVGSETLGDVWRVLRGI